MKHAMLAALVVLSACMSQENLASIDTAASHFFEQQAAGQDAEIVADSSQGFRDSATVEDLARLNGAVRALRNCTAPARDPANWRSNQTTSGHFVTVVYDRECESGGLTETITFQIIGDRAILHGYNVAGMALFPAAAPTTETPPTAPTPEATTTEQPSPDSPPAN